MKKILSALATSFLICALGGCMGFIILTFQNVGFELDWWQWFWVWFGLGTGMVSVILIYISTHMKAKKIKC